MKIIIAKDAGYCFGVRDAVDIAYNTSNDNGSVYMLGDIVHNEKVVKDLSKSGIKVVDKLSDVPKNQPILFRAHGTKKEVWEKAIDANMKIVDATCPLVYEIHEEVIKLESDGRKIIIIGDHGHDEVVGIASQVKNPVIISTPDEAKKMKKIKYAGVVSQSTQSLENVQIIINILMTKVYDLHFINTICFPTKRNQEQIKELAEKCDVMIVIGSFTSANSKRLTLLAKERNKKSYQVTCGDDVNSEWFSDTEIVGISAGASTPDYLIQEVKEKIENIKDYV